MRVEYFRMLDGYHPSKGGKPAEVSITALLVAMLILVVERRPVFIREVAWMFAERLSPEAMQLLGLRPARAKPDASRFDIRDAWERLLETPMKNLLKVLDPLSEDTNDSSLLIEVQAMLVAQDKEKFQRNKARLDEVMMRLVQLPIWDMTEEQKAVIRVADLTIDQTFQKATAKRAVVESDLEEKAAEQVAAIEAGQWPTSSQMIADASVRYYPTDSDDRKDLRLGEKDSTPKIQGLSAGNSLNLAVLINADEPLSVPRVITAATISQPNKMVSEETITLLEQTLTFGWEAGICVGDKDYWAKRLPHLLHKPARDLGFMPVTDYLDKNLGVKPGNFGGALFIEGILYSAGTPQYLKDASLDYYVHGTIDWETYQIRIHKRLKYALRLKETRGSKRIYQCPALGNSPTVTCPIRVLSAKASMAQDIVDEREEVDLDDVPVEEFRNAVCLNTQITVDDEELIRYEQEYPFGSKTWETVKRHGRNVVEGVNGELKSSGHEDIANANRRRVRGMPFNGLVFALQAMHYNMRTLEVFWEKKRREAKKAARGEHAVAKTKRARDGKRRNTYVKTTPKGHPMDQYGTRIEAAKKIIAAHTEANPTQTKPRRRSKRSPGTKS